MAMDAIFLGQAQKNARIAQANAANANDWARYAQQLEDRLRESEAALAAMRKLKDVAIAELTKVDPRHYLTVQQNRQAIVDVAYDAALNGRSSS